METYEEDLPNLVTNVMTTDATIPDTELLDPIYAYLARGLLPTEHLVDAGYNDADILVTAAPVHQVEVIGPVRVDTNWQARQGYLVPGSEPGIMYYWRLRPERSYQRFGSYGTAATSDWFGGFGCGCC